MPKRKERMAGYIRESDPSLADSTTIDSAAKAVRLYGQKEGYIYEPQHEYKEAISAYTVPYMERKKLLMMLEAAKRKEFDVLVVTEVRAISRRQVEIFIVYDMLQKYGVRLETIKEKFEDDAMGHIILGLRAGYAEIEREQSFVRMQRGKLDRIEIGRAPQNASRCYGYILIDTLREVKAQHVFNHAIVHTDENGRQWSEYTVALLILDMLLHGGSLHGVCHTLNDMGIPSPRGVHWQAGTIHRMVTNPTYMGELYARRYKQVGKRMILRPPEEWIRLDDVPAMITREEFERIQKQLQYNKAESIRNNKHEELGLLRAGYIFCGVCKRRMHVNYPSDNEKKTPRYQCDRHEGGNLGIVHNHRTQIRMPSIDHVAKEKIAETLRHPEVIRQQVEKWREQNKPDFDTTHIEERIAKLRNSLKNLFTLAQNATSDETMADIAHQMNELERQKRDAEAMLYDMDDDEADRAAIEAELVKFETWAHKVQPFLTDPEYLETASYKELRLAVKILGLRCTVYPTQGMWPYRHYIEVTVPDVLEKVTVASLCMGV
jgi:site-specific DNA recombinase